MSTNIISIISVVPHDEIHWASIIALFAVVVSACTAIFTYRISRQQITHPIRAQRIELLREALAKYLDEVHEYIDNYSCFHIKFTIQNKPTNEIAEAAIYAEGITIRLSRLLNRIELLLEPSNRKHNALIILLKRASLIIDRIHSEVNDTDPTKPEVIAQDLGSFISAATSAASGLLSEEWKQITH